jgi:hypothetical protein
MPDGPGKYDDITTTVREATGARGVVVVVLGGNRGSGFSVQCPPAAFAALTEGLRAVADEIDRWQLAHQPDRQPRPES